MVQQPRPEEGTCRIVCFNQERVAEVKADLVPEDELKHLTEFYKLLGNTTRLKIILALGKGELCVCDVAHVLGLSMPATSQQLKLLRQRGLLKHRTDGRMSYYSLAKPRLFDAIRGDVAFVENGEEPGTWAVQGAEESTVGEARCAGKER